VRRRGGVQLRENGRVLERGDRGQVVDSVARPSADDRPDHRRKLDHRRLVGVAGPAGRHEEELAGGSAGRSVADVGEVVGPGIHELQHVIPASGIRHPKRDGLHRQVDVRHRVDSVVVDRDERVLRSRHRPGMAERVERSHRVRAHTLVHIPQHLIEVEDQREAVHVTFRGNHRKIML
jgi:hypothetical protein